MPVSSTKSGAGLPVDEYSGQVVSEAEPPPEQVEEHALDLWGVLAP